ncbi:hypothetical protein E2562_037411 [Oryza meyeriana var. granulata]|uniref:Uncharacterized protein n=1 Tax=Oryza meyeriana var. granulata TaxID=110450 RepID=A0A6G1ECW4_9ORYZ|nr:hypothetical protein E2562_037411 [Oryza meyeriana var. granulata]
MRLAGGGGGGGYYCWCAHGSRRCIDGAVGGFARGSAVAAMDSFSAAPAAAWRGRQRPLQEWRLVGSWKRDRSSRRQSSQWASGRLTSGISGSGLSASPATVSSHDPSPPLSGSGGKRSSEAPNWNGNTPMDRPVIGLQTSLGQMLELIVTHTGADDLAKYSIEEYAVTLYKFCKFTANKLARRTELAAIAKDKWCET